MTQSVSIPRPPQAPVPNSFPPLTLELHEYKLVMRFTAGDTTPMPIWASGRNEALKLAFAEVYGPSHASNLVSWGKLLDWWVLRPDGSILGNALSLGFVK